MRFRHKKRGTEYQATAGAVVQDSSGAGLQEGDKVVIYEDDTGKVWVRKEAEFFDGRFELLG